MRRILWFAGGAFALAILLAVGGLIYIKLFAHGFTARARPTSLEVFAAGMARSAAMPAGAEERQNPEPASDEVLSEARAHWADHCATCHGNDGSGNVLMGRQMYPPAPDMRKEGTQKKTDGELFYIIENGVRLTGMPAWGGSAHSEEDSWKLVRFIRHLPAMTTEERREMAKLNPKTPDELKEEEEEEQFLKGEINEPKEHHHH